MSSLQILRALALLAPFLASPCAAEAEDSPQPGTEAWKRQEKERVFQEMEAKLAGLKGRLDGVTGVRVVRRMSGSCSCAPSGPYAVRDLSPDDTAALVDILKRLRFNENWDPFLLVHFQAGVRCVYRDFVLRNAAGKSVGVVQDLQIGTGDERHPYALSPEDFAAYQELTKALPLEQMDALWGKHGASPPKKR